MKHFIFKRLIQMIPILIGITLISYILMLLSPGDPTTMLMDPKVKPEDVMRIKANLGLDKPILIQYLYWLKEILRGNLGYSFVNGQKVLGLIIERLPQTLLLMSPSLILTLIITIPLGVIQAVKKGTFFDNLMTIFTFLGMSIPSFWLALIFILFFSLQLKLLPSSGMLNPLLEDAPIYIKIIDILKHLFLPLMVMTTGSLAGLTRYGRAKLLEVLCSDYIRTARAKGLKERTIIFKHGLRNSLIPIITILGLSLPSLLGGAFIIEWIFAWPGMGRLGVESIFARDYPVIMGVILFSSFMVLMGNLLADIFYAWADPRVRY